MIFTHERLDIEAMQRQASDLPSSGTDAMIQLDRVPAARFERKTGEIWRVARTAIDLGPRRTDWNLFKREDIVSVPLAPYLTSTEHDLALGFAVQLGVKLSLELGAEIARLHLVTGAPVSEEDHPQYGLLWRWWLGVAVLLRK